MLAVNLLDKITLLLSHKSMPLCTSFSLTFLSKTPTFSPALAYNYIINRHDWNNNYKDFTSKVLFLKICISPIEVFIFVSKPKSSELEFFFIMPLKSVPTTTVPRPGTRNVLSIGNINGELKSLLGRVI
jgi:hypothetical protein